MVGGGFRCVIRFTATSQTKCTTEHRMKREMSRNNWSQRMPQFRVDTSVWLVGIGRNFHQRGLRLTFARRETDPPLTRRGSVTR